ncbi:MAG: D-glycero-beta-D-manno-heptose 1-phosphate adenylyltransferase [Candidatus Eisenbacteria bacterium]|nr:D-glycero-beta-D-manno-heptose 1-phosphate adenylyltransferase [Candidatus Eisenbacteria bacterium]
MPDPDLDPAPLLDPARLSVFLDAVRAAGERLVFTNGCFDLIHPGHVQILREARALGDRLLVGLNSDASVRRLKGPGRPLLPERERAFLLGMLRCVDAVVLFEQDTPLELILAVRPHVLVKGADYTLDHVVGAEEVAGWGGEVRLLPLRAGFSTTALLDRIRNSK